MHDKYSFDVYTANKVIDLFYSFIYQYNSMKTKSMLAAVGNNLDFQMY